MNLVVEKVLDEAAAELVAQRVPLQEKLFFFVFCFFLAVTTFFRPYTASSGVATVGEGGPD